MRRVAQIMGMPISIDIPEATADSPFRAAFERLRQIDGRFSTYKTESETSRFGRGEIEESAASQELKRVIKECRSWQRRTGGWFSAWAGGKFEPSGYVKGWAVAEAGKALEAAGFDTYCIGAGGDILARSAGAHSWGVGIQDPDDKTKILNKLSISNGAVCTSGNYARGAHIINPKTGRPAAGFKSVTISGPDVVTADVLATAAFAAGRRAGRELIEKFPAYQAFIV